MSVKLPLNTLWIAKASLNINIHPWITNTSKTRAESSNGKLLEKIVINHYVYINTCVCVCVRERERVCIIHVIYINTCVCVCVCVCVLCVRERESMYYTCDIYKYILCLCIQTPTCDAYITVTIPWDLKWRDRTGYLMSMRLCNYITL
jgi:hypothetical protein